MDVGKDVTVVLCTGDGEVLGALPSFPVPTPWWPEVTEVVRGCRHRHAADVTVLRLLTAPADLTSGGEVAYLAELTGAVPADLRPWSGDPTAEHPLRQGWARPGGPRRELGWAVEQLADAGRPATGRPQQVKTWNLSSIWRVPTADGDVWLKSVPPFFAHEGLLMTRLDPSSVPRPLAAQPGRVLLPDVVGTDQFHATGEPLTAMVEQLVALQVPFLGRTEDLLALGVPDRRLTTIAPRLAEVVREQTGALGVEELRRLEHLLQTLDARAERLAACGIPDTLVHGDFHPGNVRGTPGDLAILDWSDSAVGHPLTDELAFFRPLGRGDRERVAAVWSTAWRRVVPGCEPERAVGLLRPVMPLVAAMVYADLCAGIEPDERVYHARDVPACLREAAAAAAVPGT
ncbi:aminoglycoside phosphotransferase family protein [Auraticoccus monumenti]|uniref:aminoglycoside phosphotransferase family protein n=1 Tax=Auraticoccus monumenti TaxID=675864 RepID=UPI000B88B65D|nr:aminoglycoside phosphotransferase family protein [Auraticoccus monumenti]